VMQGFQGTATARVEAAPEAIFALITNIDRLPEWNDAIESVAERPPELEVGSEWLVVMHPRHVPRWRSRSTVEDIDRDARRFAFDVSSVPPWRRYREPRLRDRGIKLVADAEIGEHRTGRARVKDG